ncbi:MAG: amidinotransferase [Gammaproteobacteria bacterium]|nr:amidinotransferase [Gammaproteobacteria bacterium]
MQAQSTNTILMIEPVAFGTNTETAESNIFQMDGEINNPQELALTEFNGLVDALESNGVNVIRVQDSVEPRTTDSIFPNNWITTHADGTVVLYPMEAPSRRLERREDILEILEQQYGFQFNTVLDFSPHEMSQKYLEGTGSLILDRINKIAYACYSSRTDKELLELWAASLGYSVCGFDAAVKSGEQIYHTNVMMCLGSKIAVICLDAITDSGECMRVIDSLEESGHSIVEITEEQMFQFAGNMLEVRGAGDKPLMLMSQAAHDALNPDQIKTIEEFNKIVASPIPTIEYCGGGSVRCMLAEVFLPKGEKNV